MTSSMIIVHVWILLDSKDDGPNGSTGLMARLTWQVFGDDSSTIGQVVESC